MLPTIEERAQQHKGTPAQCAYFSRRRHVASFGPNATLVAAPAAHIACFRRMHPSPFRCGFPRASPPIFPRAVQRRGIVHNQNSVQKACRMWHARPVSKRSGRITPNPACKTPGHKVCDLGFPFRIPFQKHVNATFEAHCEQKRERSYNPKRFLSSSLMIFNAFTRA